MSTQQIQYIQYDGKFYQVVPRPDGEFDYVLNEDPTLSFQDNGDGTFNAVHPEAFARMKKADSHKDFVGDLDAFKGKSIPEARRRMKWLEQIEGITNSALLPRISPGGAPYRTIKDEQFMDLMTKYKEGKADGFLPLSAYQHKLITKSGKVLRPLFQGEVGMEGDIILVLEQGFGTGTLIQVGHTVGASK